MTYALIAIASGVVGVLLGVTVMAMMALGKRADQQFDEPDDIIRCYEPQPYVDPRQRGSERLTPVSTVIKFED